MQMFRKTHAFEAGRRNTNYLSKNPANETVEVSL
jgi:hypothetical protein